MKGERIVRRAPSDRKKGRTDWQRLRDMTEEEIERGAASDQENPPWTEEELRNAQLVLPSGEAKVPLSIRLDREVVEYFKEQGPGYQSRIGAVLLSYVRSQGGVYMKTPRASASQRTSTKKSQTTTAKRAARAGKKTRTRK